MIYSQCELIHNVYNESVTYANIVNGFKACGVWCAVRRRAIPEVIKITDITNTDGHATRQEAFSSFVDLCTSYRTSRNLLRSDGPVMQNGTLNTKGGALLTRDDVLKELWEREVARAAAARARVEREAAAVNRRIQREREAEERIWARDGRSTNCACIVDVGEGWAWDATADKICMFNLNWPIVVVFKFGVRLGRNALFEAMLSREETAFAVKRGDSRFRAQDSGIRALFRHVKIGFGGCLDGDFAFIFMKCTI